MSASLPCSEAAKLVCPATGASLLVDFGAPVTAINSHSVRTIVNNADFFVENLEAGPSEFTVTLDTCGVAAGTRLVTSVAYADAEGNRADVSGLLSAGSVAECSRASAARRKLHDDHFDCSVCESLTSAEIEALAKYDNGGKKIVCDPTCLDGVTDPLHCNCEFHEEGHSVDPLNARIVWHVVSGGSVLLLGLVGVGFVFGEVFLSGVLPPSPTHQRGLPRHFP